MTWHAHQQLSPSLPAAVLDVFQAGDLLHSTSQEAVAQALVRVSWKEDLTADARPRRCDYR
jgi:hypothetical protein